MSHGILNEIYNPRVDRACTRDLGFIVTDGKTYFSEEKRHARSETSQVALGVPAYRIVNTALDGRYRLEKEAGQFALGYVPPAEFEAAYYQQQRQAMAA